MTLEVIYVTRHGFRSNWVVDPATGEYSTTIKSPTGIASDPALAGYGVGQAKELAAHLVTVSPPIERFYSSPFYRCIQTLDPTLELLKDSKPDSELRIRGENGIGEWYGMARFDHPSPADPKLLNELFPRFDLDYQAVIKPSVNGETIDELHDRTAYALHRIIEQSDKEGVKAIIICTHAATLIAIGRCLTGRMPKDIEAEDFHPFTCGLSTFTRKQSGETAGSASGSWSAPGDEIPKVAWKDGNGVGGGWTCKTSGDCSFLSGGQERGWRFSGDESFTAPPTDAGAVLDAGSGLGVVIDGKKGSPRL
ncbi:phosphoglycerate mutase [Phlyctema vagabunda]|uniref:Phosphoglycerate mutase n=1 Tax=Phlyctema vagabunda TaxID=108571 RepID=A0ABR4PRL0_9HELO